MFHICPLCNFEGFEVVLNLEQVPIFQLVSDPNQVDSGYFGSLYVVRCNSCGHLYNRAYSEVIGNQIYQGDVLSNVPVNVSMSKNLERIAKWIGLSNYKDKHVVEIGAGSGHLSRLLAQFAKSVIVFEPSRGLIPEMLPEENIFLINKPFSASEVSESFDLIVCRQVLEHIPDPLLFLHEIRSSMAESGSCYLEVPRAEYVEEKALIIDFHYPHIHYFHERNLLALASKADLVVERSWQLMEGHDFGVLLRPQQRTSPIKSSTQASATLGNLVFNHGLSAKLQDKLCRGDDFLKSLPGNVALYGASWHGVAFLSSFQSSHQFYCVFDDNNDYLNRNLYSLHQTIPVYSPTLQNLREVETVIITAYLHRNAINENVRRKGFTGKVVCGAPEIIEMVI